MKYNTIAVAYLSLVIVIAHALVPQPYSWSENTISELGAQGYDYGWIMRAGFIGFGALVFLGAAQRARKPGSAWFRELPLMIYGLGVLVSGLFSAKPFMEGVPYLEAEARLHSTMATAAGAAISIAVVLYLVTDKSVRGKMAHLMALALIVALSALFGASPTGAGIVQRLLYMAGFAWLVYIELRPSG
jgi:hypothetical membrane protein